MMKNNLFLFTDFNSLNATLVTHNILISNLSEYFQIYLVNSNFKYKKRVNYKKLKIFGLKKKINLINFKSKKQYEMLFQKKRFYIWNNFNFANIYIHRLIKKYNKIQIIISNIGNLQWQSQYSKNNILRSINIILLKFLIKFYLVLLIKLKLIKKIDIRFQSDKKLNEKKEGIFVKKSIKINSRLYDYFKNKKIYNNRKYITHIDLNLDHQDDVAIRGKLHERDKKDHYECLNKTLFKLSKLYRKPVIVCIHPMYNLKNTQKNFPNFKVVKYKTREMIEQSEIVTFFDSSSIFDAVYLGKKIIALQNIRTGNAIVEKTNKYVSLLDLPFLDIHNFSEIKRKEIENQFKKSKKKLEEYSLRFLKFQKEFSYKTIINYLNNAKSYN